MLRLTEGMNLPAEPLPGIPLIEVFGNSRVLIENHGGVCRYTDNEICVNVSYGRVSVQGSCLEVTRMTREQLIISGCVMCVRLIRNGG